MRGQSIEDFLGCEVVEARKAGSMILKPGFGPFSEILEKAGRVSLRTRIDGLGALVG